MVEEMFEGRYMYLNSTSLVVFVPFELPPAPNTPPPSPMTMVSRLLFFELHCFSENTVHARYMQRRLYVVCTFSLEQAATARQQQHTALMVYGCKVV